MCGKKKQKKIIDNNSASLELTGVTQDSATKNETKTTIPVKISRVIPYFRKVSRNSSDSPVMTHSKPPI